MSRRNLDSKDSGEFQLTQWIVKQILDKVADTWYNVTSTSHARSPLEDTIH